MKQVLLAVSSLFSAAVFAQMNQDGIMRKKLEALTENGGIGNELEKLFPYSNKENPLQAYLKDPKLGMHRLPQDGMPCIVPDTNSIVAIPNMAPRIEVPFRSRIPNGTPLKSPLNKFR